MGHSGCGFPRVPGPQRLSSPGASFLHSLACSPLGLWQGESCLPTAGSRFTSDSVKLWARSLPCGWGREKGDVAFPETGPGCWGWR